MIKNTKIINNVKVLILAIICVLGMSYAFADWTAPTCVPPQCNKSSPINSSSFSQGKPGTFAIGSVGSPSLSYAFIAENGTSKFSDIVAKQLVYVDGKAQRAGKVLTSDSNGIASWITLQKNLTSESFTISVFSINVPRRTHETTAGVGINLSIPATNQYCALSQVGPDFGESNNIASVCSVSQNNDGTWTLHGDRSDDPDMICKAQCFYSNSISPVTRITP